MHCKGQEARGRVAKIQLGQEEFVWFWFSFTEIMQLILPLQQQLPITKQTNTQYVRAEFPSTF